MNTRAIYDLAIILTKSQLRGAQRSKLVARLFGDPKIILVADLLLLAGLGAVGFVILQRSPPALATLILGVEGQALSGIPTAITFAVIVFGVLYEVSQPVQLLSTDLVNWLPISPTEYVAGSTISESYIYSFMLCILLGALLGPALYLGTLRTWVAAVFMASVALFMGSCVVELIDSITNRISSTFYKRSGRSGIIFRLVITIVFLVFIQLVFSGQIAVYLLRGLVTTVQVAWFVPVIWPSVSVLSLSQGSLVNALTFAFLSLVFTWTLFEVAVVFRTRFWVPVPVSIRFAPSTYRPSGPAFRLPGVGLAESAILRKDMKSLVRRREMARYLAIPFVLAVSMGLSMFSMRGDRIPEGMTVFTTAFLYIFPVSIFCELLGMTSIGQEGHAVWNLYAAPLTARTLFRAKFILISLLGSIFAVAMAVVLGLLLRPSPAIVTSLLILGIGIVVEQGTISMIFGARFPDFRETVRSRYVSMWGSLLGMGTGLGAAFLTASPIMGILVVGLDPIRLSLVSLVIAIGISLIAYRVANSQLQMLFRNIRT